MRFFNTAGPCKPDIHYMLPASARLPELRTLIDQQAYIVGLRDVRDYKVKSGGSERLTTASPSNIKLESLTLGNFTEEEVATLYRQHTAETGQVFADEALRRAFELTQGQPWLVNALARQAVEFIETDRRKPITPAITDQAKERIIERQETHLDSLKEGVFT